MMVRQFFILLITVTVVGCNSSSQKISSSTLEPHRPAFHFTPQKNWMNDPNGMVYHNGIYHLFFQYNPDSTVWGPMHWGHATSNDMVNWVEQPVALFPDSLGTIFSGSAVIDINNTAGFGYNAMVAIYTNHNHELEKQGSQLYETQSIAYSLDEGKSWTKYDGNPVVKNPGIIDFRDPKVMWYGPSNKWIMTLATKDRITFYSSDDLKSWEKESEFGASIGAHTGVWECPDLIKLNYEGRDVWVLLVSINPGAPNGGSGTQYFLGDFNGKQFTAYDTLVRWMDFGTDNYAGVTFSNTDERAILMGWMSNWQYAKLTPTKHFRSATTLPRELSIQSVNGRLYLASQLTDEVEQLIGESKSWDDLLVKGKRATPDAEGLFNIAFEDMPEGNFSVVLSNSVNEQFIFGFDKTTNQYFIDRTRSGIVDFEKGFAKKYFAPRLSDASEIHFRIIVDRSSVEIFADGGLTVITTIVFPNKPYTTVSLASEINLDKGKVTFSKVNKANLR